MSRTQNSKVQLFKSPSFIVSFFLTSSLLAVSTGVYANTSDNNKKLEQVQAKIKQQRQAIEKRLAEKDDIEALFKSTELRVAEMALAIRKSSNQLAQVNKQISALEKEQKQLLKQKKNQQALLAELVKTAYLSGKHDYTKLLLNQDDPAKLERLITYYKSLNKARVEELDEIEKVLNRLTQVETELSAKRSQILDLKASQQEQKKQLARSQKKRKAALSKLNARIKTDQDRLKQLQQSESRLSNAIAQAQREAKKSPENLAGLYNLKKKLTWPTRGRIRKKFGQRRSGALRWKGVYMSANLGNRVNAIAEGIDQKRVAAL